MSAKPKISIIIPVYNKAETIGQCVESLLNQSRDSFEVILIDDGSTDSSGVICDKYAKEGRFRIVHQENAGPSHARNVGLRLAQSDYVAFVDADDLVSPLFAEILIGQIRANNDMVITSSRESKRDVLRVGSIDPEKALKELLYASSFAICPWGCEVWGKLYRKELAAKLRFDETLWTAEDLDFNYRFLKKAQRIAVVDCRIYFHTEYVRGSLTKVIGPTSTSPVLVAKRIYDGERCETEDKIRAAQACVTAFSLYFFQLVSEGGEWNSFCSELKSFDKKSVFFNILSDPCVSRKLKSKFLLFQVSKRAFFLYYRIRVLATIRSAAIRARWE